METLRSIGLELRARADTLDVSAVRNGYGERSGRDGKMRQAYKLLQLLAVAAAPLQARMQAEMPDVSCAEAKAAAPRTKRRFVNCIVRRGMSAEVVTVVREQRVGLTHVEFD